MIYEDETALIRKGLFDVQNEVGLGRHEEIYHKALAIWFQKQEIPFVSKAPHPLSLNGMTAHVLYPDFVVWDKITIELKALPHRLQNSEHVQLFNYLKCREDKLGLLVNMGLDRVQAKRIIFESKKCEYVENWDHWNIITETDRNIGLQTRAVLKSIFDIHTTGYGKELIEKLIHFGLRQKGLKIMAAPIGASTYQGRELGKTPFDCLLIENCLLLVFTALFDDNQFNFHRGLSFMNALNIPWGIAANFGKETVQLLGLSVKQTTFPIRGSGFPSVGQTTFPIRGSGFPSVVHNITIQGENR